jgi:ABC-type phosphate transport system substrate-binding protein
MRGKAGILKLALIAGVIATASASEAGPDEIAVVVGQAGGLSQITRDQLKSVFQTQSTKLPGGEKAVPVNLPQGSGVRVDFDKAVLGLGPDEVARYWVDRKIRGGNGPPMKLDSPALVVLHVARTPGAIGYVPAGDARGSVKVVARIRGGKVVAP